MSMSKPVPPFPQLAMSLTPPEEPADGRVRRVKDLTLFFFSAVLLAVIVGFSLWLLSSSCVLEEDRRWATSTLTAVFGGVLGWLIKR